MNIMSLLLLNLQKNEITEKSSKLGILIIQHILIIIQKNTTHTTSSSVATIIFLQI